MTYDEPPFDPDYDHPGGHTPAQDVSAEQALLGALILQPTAIPAVANILTGAEHYRPAHETIHHTLTRLHDADRPIDTITLVAELDRSHQLTAVGGPLYVHQLTEACPNPAAAEAYAETVRDKARARTLYEVGTRLRQLGTTGDPNDLDTAFDAAYTTLDKAAANFGPVTTPANTGLADLTWILTGTPPVVDPPSILARTDNHHLFYTGKINGLFGDPEGGKTWVAQAAIVETLAAGGTAAMIDVDHNGPNHTAARLLLLGAEPTTLANPDRFRYYDPEDAEQLRGACKDIATRAPTIAVVDSLGELLPMYGASENDGTEVTDALRTTLVPIAATGTCVISIDHLPKAGESRQSGYAIGSIAKKRMMRGSYIRVEARNQPAPGKIGRMTLKIEKDTSGKVREFTGGGYAGTFILDSTNPTHTTWEINTADNPTAPDGTFRPTHLMEAVSRFVEDNDLATGRDITTHINGKTTAIREAIKLLIHEGYLTTVAGPRNSTKHHVAAIYREADDPNNHPPEDTP